MINELNMDSRALAELVLHLGRIASGEALVEGLTPHACGFTPEPLLLEELDGVCINFVPGKPKTVKGSVTGAAPR